jgi:hypothetical protein
MTRQKVNSRKHLKIWISSRLCLLEFHYLDGSIKATERVGTLIFPDIGNRAISLNQIARPFTLFLKQEPILSSRREFFG